MALTLDHSGLCRYQAAKLISGASPGVLDPLMCGGSPGPLTSFPVVLVLASSVCGAVTASCLTRCLIRGFAGGAVCCVDARILAN